MPGGKNKLYEDLKRQILTMELDPDSNLDEVSLGERYGVSRTPVREIFRRLEGEGYVSIQENRGARVTPMNHSTLRSFFQVAPMIYAAIGRLATQNHKRAQLDVLQEVQERYRRASILGEPYAMVIENNRFHEMLGEMSGNVYLCASLNRLLIDHARIGHTFYRPRDEDMQKRVLVSVEHHDLMITAIEQRDEDLIVDTVFEHWELSREDMELFVAPQSLEQDSRVALASLTDKKVLS